MWPLPWAIRWSHLDHHPPPMDFRVSCNLSCDLYTPGAWLPYRFTVNGPKNKKLPGKPDIVLPKYNTVIFVHGCFWHRHKDCKGTTTPKTRTEWWQAKFARNVSNDRKNQVALAEAGWNVIIVWECELRQPENVLESIRLQFNPHK